MTGGALLFIAFGALLLAAIVALFGNRLPNANPTIALIGSFCAGVAAVAFAFAPPLVAFGGKYAYTSITKVSMVAFCIMMVLWTMWVSGRVKHRTREAVALAFLSLLGAGVMISAREFITFIVAFELVVMPLYILGGYWEKRRSGMEGTLKQFLFSIVSTMIMVYGISLIYATSGSTFFADIDVSHAGPIGTLGLMMIMIGILTKVGAAPFHFWVPDAYCGATIWVLAFMGTIAKSASAIAFLMIVSTLWNHYEGLSLVLAGVATLSLIIGSFGALIQERISRILAYSTVVNAGYLIVAMASYGAVGQRAITAAVVYSLFYAFAVMGILFITSCEGETLDDLHGLSKRRPAASWALLICSLSLIGVPPLGGFFAKLNVFIVGLSSDYWFVILLAAVATVISAFYYLRLVKASFFDADDWEPHPSHGYRTRPNICATLAIGAATLIVAGGGMLIGFMLDVMR